MSNEQKNIRKSPLRRWGPLVLVIVLLGAAYFGGEQDLVDEIFDDVDVG